MVQVKTFLFSTLRIECDILTFAGKITNRVIGQNHIMVSLRKLYHGKIPFE